MKLAPWLLVLLFTAGPADAGAILSGHVTHIRDTDTIEMDGVAVRLQGLHAPEPNEPGGPTAAAAMADIIESAGGQLTCELNGETSNDRVIGVCFTQAGDDIAALLVATGLARDCPHFSGGRYQRFEAPEAASLILPGYCQ